MSELLPEAWAEGLSEDMQKLFGKRCRAPVLDILRWVQCFSALTSVLSPQYPQFMPKFMAYLSIIVKCSRDYEGLVWMQYDRAFRRQAGASKDLQWSKVNTSLFSLCFTGKAKTSSLFQTCCSSEHSSTQCPESWGPAWPWPSNQLAPVPFGQQTPAATRPPIQNGMFNARNTHRRSQICGLFNSRKGNVCSYRSCRYAHTCSKCRGDHPTQDWV